MNNRIKLLTVSVNTILLGFLLFKCTPISVVMNGSKVTKASKHTKAKITAEMSPLTKEPTDWPCWRGPDGNGRSNITGISTDWTVGLNKKWEIDYLCQEGKDATWSAPVVQGNRLIVCGRDSLQDLVFCLHPDTGELIWKTSYTAPASDSYGTGPRATPCIDNDRVYTFGRSGDLVCWHLLDGTRLWHQNVQSHGGEELQWGYSSSPLVLDSLVVVNGGGTARSIALDKLTGDVLWKSGSGPAGYSSITKMMIQGNPVLLNFHGNGLSALHPADGVELWDIPYETRSDVNATTPVFEGNLIFITSVYGKGGQLMKTDGKQVETLWSNKNISSHHSDPFIIDGYIYGYSGYSMQNRGKFKCVDLTTGEEQWSTNKMGWGTCVSVDGYLLCCNIKGDLFLMKPNPDAFTLITQMPKALGDVQGASWTVPVLANDKLYLRFKQKLICYDIMPTG